MIVQNISSAHGITLIACVSLAYVLLASATGEAEAQSYTGILVLDQVPSSASVGDTITFSGQLTTTSGHVVTGAAIQIKDDVSFGRDRTIVTAYTDDNGEFYASWTAQSRSGAYDFYAVYEGASNISGDRSRTQSMTVSSYGTSNDYGSTRASSITLYGIPSSVYAGTQVTFSGQLTSNEQPLGEKLVKIYDDDPGSDDLLGYGWTDYNGRFSILWMAEQGLVETELEIYAVFDGDDNYERDRSANQKMSVVKHSGSITLDPLPGSASVGEMVTISGTIHIDGYTTNGAVVYIKDEDTLRRDDLLATAFADSSGKFSVEWRAYRADPGNNVEIFAVFEGNDRFKRLTTCGPGCLNTNTIQIRDTPLPISAPPGGTTTSAPSTHLPFRSDLIGPEQPPPGESIRLYYSMDLPREPSVYIVIDPDSYDDARPYIGQVMEGLRLAGMHLEQQYGGNWDVNVSVLPQGDTHAPTSDMVVNLDHKGRDEYCQKNDVYGYAYPSANSRPIQTTVCSSAIGGNNIQRTTMHEFLHGMGLGHVFNVPRDMMCSAEPIQWHQGTAYSQCSAQDNVACIYGKKVYTCGRDGLRDKSERPSTLDMAGIVRLYGTDGFKNPNNDVDHNSWFPWSYVSGGDAGRTSPESTQPRNTQPAVPPAATQTTNECPEGERGYDYDIRDLVVESGHFRWYTICNAGPLHYSLATEDRDVGFSLYFVAPGSDVSRFINDDQGSYYEACSGLDQRWLSKSGECHIGMGTKVVFHNDADNSHSVTINGHIRAEDPCQDGPRDYDIRIKDKVIKSGWYTSWEICNDGPFEFSFATEDRREGFFLYVVHPDTDVKAFVKDHKGLYYPTCSDPDQGWYGKSGTCNPAFGSKVILYNDADNQDSVTINGYIRTE